MPVVTYREPRRVSSRRRAPRAPGPGTLRINAIRGLPELCEEMDLDLASMLAAAEIRLDVFDDLDNLITYRSLATLLEECERRSGCDHFGLLIGQRTRLVDMGLAGTMALCSDTAGAGLANYVKFFNLHDGAAITALGETGALARFVYAICEPGLSNTQHFQFGGIAIACNILEDLCGPKWRPVEVTFSCRSPSDPQPLRRFFRAPLRFEAEEASFSFERSWLARPLPPGDGAVCREATAEAEALMTRVMGDFPASIRRLLRRQLLGGRGSMAEIAAILSMHRRTLDRHLQAHGTSFGELVASVKYDIAGHLLRHTDMPVGQIAEALHYSTAANFSTAFRRWSGMTPVEYRSSGR